MAPHKNFFFFFLVETFQLIYSSFLFLNAYSSVLTLVSVYMPYSSSCLPLSNVHTSIFRLRNLDWSFYKVMKMWFFDQINCIGNNKYNQQYIYIYIYSRQKEENTFNIIKYQYFVESDTYICVCVQYIPIKKRFCLRHSTSCKFVIK